MSDTTPYADLDLEESPTLQRRERFWQRVGWIFLYSIVGATLLGFFGDGPLSRATAVSKTPGSALSPALTADYQRFARVGKSTRIAICLISSPPHTGELTLEVDRRFFDTVQIERITPEPDRIVLTPQTIYLVFASAHLRKGDGILLDYQPTHGGLRTFHFGFGDSVLELSQLTHF